MDLLKGIRTTHPRFKKLITIKNKTYSLLKPRRLSYKTTHDTFFNQLTKDCLKADIGVISAGWPDCLLLVNGKIVLIEIKTGGANLSLIQKRVYDLLTSKGIPYFIYRGQKGFLDTVLKLIE